ncbi:MAG: hypothetical protein FVQ81_18355 [Candidatus Glassbacteria bacterium]|nr:hypothetical protein [Candidatus Glassbacteria bacterium]
MAAAAPVISWSAVGGLMSFIMIWSGVMLWAMKRILAGVEDKLDGHISEFKDLEAKLTALQIELPKEYVRREDWIRFGTTIDAKLDRVHDRLDELKAKVS